MRTSWIHGGGGRCHLANVCETNGSGSRADWLQRQRSCKSPCRRGSIRMARRNSTRVDRCSDNDVTSQWRGLQTTREEAEENEGSRNTRLLSSILDELRQLTGKVERDEARQDEINDQIEAL